VTLSLKKQLTASKQTSRLILFITLVLLCFSSIYAANADFNKLGSLANLRYGQDAYKNIQELNQLVSELKSVSEVEKLQQINDFFNRKIRFTDDTSLWGQTDYWATPLESLGRQAGDCEDFSIAKYIFLKVVDVDNDKLRLTYVRAEIQDQNRRSVRAHMVLSYYPTPQSEPLILDNLTPEILPASSRKDLSPIFSFNKKGLWVGSGSKPKGEAQTNLSRWRDVLSRIKADGIE
jgi:predicted transglutaminase-like cysteine proteinase